jgi:hypothetical protein
VNVPARLLLQCRTVEKPRQRSARIACAHEANPHIATLQGNQPGEGFAGERLIAVHFGPLGQRCGTSVCALCKNSRGIPRVVGAVNDLTPSARAGDGEAIAYEGIFAGQGTVNGWPGGVANARSDGSRSSRRRGVRMQHTAGWDGAAAQVGGDEGRSTLT